MGTIFMSTVFTATFLLWNTFNILEIGFFFEISPYIVIYILSSIVVITTLFLSTNRVIITVILSILLTLLYLGYRGYIFDLITPQAPLNIHELINLAVSVSIYSVGIYLVSKGDWEKSVLTAIASIFTASIFWSIKYSGFVFFSKASHYMPLVIALSIAGLSSRVNRWMVTVLLSIFLIRTSLYGLSYTMDGLSTYRITELQCTNNIMNRVDRNISIYVDTRASSYIENYLGKPTKIISPTFKGLMIIYEANLRSGVLYGYQWVSLDDILPPIKLVSFTRIYDSNVLIALVTRE